VSPRPPAAPRRAPPAALLAALLAACASPASVVEVNPDEFPPVTPPPGGGAAGGGAAGLGGGPELGRVGDRVAEVGRELLIQLVATHPAGAPLSFSLLSRLPAGAAFDKPRGLFSWRPAEGDVGQSTLLTFEVSDGALKDQETIAVTVQPAGSVMNLPPAVVPVSDQSLRVGQPWALQVEASDPNGDPLTYALSGDVPPGLALDGGAGRLAWTPEARDVGVRALTLTVSDGLLSVPLPLLLVVRDPNDMSADVPPSFSPMGPVAAVVGQLVSFQVSAQDDNPSALSFALERGPQGAAFSPSDRRFSWTPTAEYAQRAVEVVLSVTDGTFKSYLLVTLQVAGAPSSSEPCPRDDYPDGATHRVLVDAPLAGLLLCEEGAVDTYSFTLSEEAQVEAQVSFDARVDLDLDLYDAARVRLAFSNDMGTSSERVSARLPAGEYALAVTLYGGRAAQYSLSVVTGAAPLDPLDPLCAPDEFDQGGLGGRNDSPDAAAPIALSTYRGLTACGDEDWFSAPAAVDRPLALYVRSDDFFASVRAYQYDEELAILLEDVPSGADGCYDPGAGRAACRRAEVRPPYDGPVVFSVNLTLPGAEYDLLARVGEEVSAPCADAGDCADGYECLSSLNGLYLSVGACSRACDSSFECGGDRRECVLGLSSDAAGSCLQACQSPFDCRDGFSCAPRAVVGGFEVDVCVPQ